MPKISTKENKNIYFRKREELGLTREKASELLEIMSVERIERIESEKSEPRPDEVLLMSEKYKFPDLCNYYCSKQCKIGEQYVPQVELQDLSQIVLKTVSAVNSVQKQKDRFIDISADGKIDKSEIEEFISIQEELERVSIAVEALQLWTERMLCEGKIDKDIYEECLKNRIK